MSGTLGESCGRAPGGTTALDDTRSVAVDPTATTRLLLIRHGEVVEEAIGTLYGQRDVALSERGLAQSRAAAEALSGVRLDAVYSSDLVRARTLADLLCSQRAFAPTVTEDLRERHFGDWQYMPWKQVESSDPERFAAYWANRFAYRAPGGAENFSDVRARVIPAVERLVCDHQGEVVALAAHSGPLRIIIAEALGLPVEHIFRFEMGYCSMAVVDWTEGGWRVLTLNSYDYAASAGATSLAGRLK